jgi:predicted RNase H-like HicB family nuclease
MIQDFINTFLSQARYEMIDGGERFYSEIPALRGVWATGKNLEECRTNLLSALEGWLIFRLRNKLAVPRFKTPAKVKKQKVYV